MSIAIQYTKDLTTLHNKQRTKTFEINHTLKRVLKNRWALSTVVTTLIILVISVLLASVVTYFAINVVSTRVQEESLALTKQHLYHNSTALPETESYAQGTLMVINTGGRDIVIDKLAVRGQECSWNDDTTNKKVLFCVTTDSVSADMPYVSNFNLTATDPADNQVEFGSTTYDFTLASNDLVLRSGYTMMVYIINPDSITINDIGLTCSITLYTAQAMYYRESNVQAVS
ncbi:hypothetical protein GX563_10980 [Candidatus Bathyarchaeota archaeon]|nr:hypothetical protein [Candidatus Bathyarchaeota archaeon]